VPTNFEVLSKNFQIATSGRLHTHNPSSSTMPVAVAPNSSLELLTFLTDPNSQVRQVAVSNVVGFTSKQSSRRNLLIDIHKDLKGKQILGRDGTPMDTIRDLKNLCKDQPISAHDAFSSLINLSDSLIVAKRVGDKDFLEFLVSYIAVSFQMPFNRIPDSRNGKG